jgi:hypothetical protein
MGIVLLTSDFSRFPIKVTFVTDYDALGVGKLRSYTYCIVLHPGVNIITWCKDSGFVYDPFPLGGFRKHTKSALFILFPMNFLMIPRRDYPTVSSLPLSRCPPCLTRMMDRRVPPPEKIKIGFVAEKGTFFTKNSFCFAHSFCVQIYQ